MSRRGFCWQRFATIWILVTAVYLLVALLGLNGLTDEGTWPRVNQHRLQLAAWFGQDVNLPSADLHGNGVVRLGPRLDVTPWIRYSEMRAPQEAALAANIAAVAPLTGDSGPPWRPLQGSGEGWSSPGVRAFVGVPLGPTVALLPFHFLLGSGGGAQWVGAIFGGLAVAAADVVVTLWLAAVAWGGPSVRRDVSNEIVLLAAAGTVLTLAAPDGGTPAFAQTVAVAGLTLALWAALAGRPLVAGGGWAVAFLSRPPMLLAGLLLVALLPAVRTGGRGRVTAMARLAFAPVVLTAAHLVLNQLRFGTPLEFGYSFMLTPTWLLERFRTFGQLSLHFLPENLYWQLVAPPTLVRHAGDAVFPFLASNPMGMGLLFTTPAFVLAALSLARPVGESRLVAMCWLTLVALLLPGALYFNTGWVQWGARFLLDGWPLWLMLTALGLVMVPRAVGRTLIGLSVLSVGWGALLMILGEWPGCCM